MKTIIFSLIILILVSSRIEVFGKPALNGKSLDGKFISFFTANLLAKAKKSHLVSSKMKLFFFHLKQLLPQFSTSL